MPIFVRFHGIRCNFQVVFNEITFLWRRDANAVKCQQNCSLKPATLRNESSEIGKETKNHCLILVNHCLILKNHCLIYKNQTMIYRIIAYASQKRRK